MRLIYTLGALALTLLFVPAAQAQCTDEIQNTKAEAFAYNDAQEIGQSLKSPCDGYLNTVTISVASITTGPLTGTLRLFSGASMVTATEVASEPFSFAVTGDHTITFSSPYLSADNEQLNLFFDLATGEGALDVAGDLYPNTSGKMLTGPEANSSIPDNNRDMYFIADFDELALPVELTAFTVRLDADRAELAWTTASETNNAGFEVQHRAPGAAAFADAAWVPGAGTTTSEQHYRSTLEGLAPGLHTFRLRQVDHDGASALSDEVEATVTIAGTHMLEVWPNPSADDARVRVAVSQAGPVRLAVYDLLGRLVADWPTLEATPGAPVQVDLPQLPSGVYLVTARGAQFTETVRVVVR